jgi:hypothetical protein
MLTLQIEFIAACAVFTFLVFCISRNPVKFVFNYPPAIIERCKDLGLVDDSNRRWGPGFIIVKLGALILFGVALGLLMRYVNGCETFWSGTLTAYALACVVDWYDALGLDCIWFCHGKRFIIPGTEDMKGAYHDYRFHIKGTLIGMLLLVPLALIAGLVTVYL